MRTKIILTALFSITVFWSYYLHNFKKLKLKELIPYIFASIPLVLYVFFGGNTWAYSFLGVILWMSGFYFGEVVMWWGIWFLTIGSNYWYIGIVGPLITTYLRIKSKK